MQPGCMRPSLLLTDACMRSEALMRLSRVQVALGDKPRTEPRGNNRVLCDQCGTGIADMYRSCGECGIDVCLRCCADQRRAIRHVSPASGVFYENIAA